MRSLYMSVFVILVFHAFSTVDAIPQGCAISNESLAGVIEPDFGEDLNLAPLETDHISMSVLPIRACRVSLKIRVPAIEYVALDLGEGWATVKTGTDLKENWQDSLWEALGDAASDPILLSNPGGLASDFCALFVNQDRRYGKVLNSFMDIPCNYESSDIFRDLLRSGLDKEEVCQALLVDVPLGISPPSLVDMNGVRFVSFFTWDYFGGVVVEWRYFIEPKRILVRAHAVGIGSYDFLQ